MLEIWAVQVPNEIPKDQFNFLLEIIGASKKERIQKMFRKEDKYRSLIGDILVRILISSKFNIELNEIIFGFNDYGKPHIENFPINFNISHSGEWVVCAIHDYTIGIDVEEIKSMDYEIVNSFFSEAEKLLINSILDKSNKLNTFYELWTLKESYVKAVGKGLSIPFNSFTIRKQKNEILLVNNNNCLDKEFHFKEYDVSKYYKVSVCAKKAQFPTQVNKVGFSSLLTFAKWG